MDAPTSLHPTDQALRAYGLGQLDDATAESVHAHLEGCDSCRRKAAEMTADSFLGRLRDGQSPGGPPSEPGRAASARSQAGPAAMPAGTLPPGLADHKDYELVRELGRGGMGVVYLVRNRLMGRNEVLKVMAGHLVERPEVRERFLREIRSVASLRHPNIVAAHHAFHVDGTIAFTMEYVEGYDLSGMVKARGPLPVAHACLFAHQAAQALQYAHEEGMVHRDIKPGNLMVARRGEKAIVKVLDFGLAKAAREGQFDGALTHAGQMLGTPDFIAPEQIADAQSADIRADVYSLGCTLYYLLSGGAPFRATSLYDLLQAHHSMDARLLNFVRTEVPSELAALVAKMMAKEPGRRFQAPGEVSEALAPFYKKGGVPRSAGPEVSQLTPPEPPRLTPAAGPMPASPGPGGPPAPSSPKPDEPPRPEEMWASLVDLREKDSNVAEPLAKPAASGPPRKPPRKSGPLIAAASLFGFIALGIVIYITFRAESTKDSSKTQAGGTTPPAAGVVAEDSGPAPVSSPLTSSGRYEIKRGRWRRDGNELVQDSAGETNPILFFGDANWTDYDISADVMRIEGNDLISLFFRVAEPGHFYSFSLMGGGNTRCDLCSHDDKIIDKIIALGRTSVRLKGKQWYTMRVRVRGAHLECTAHDGDRQVARFVVDDGKYSKGGVGFSTWHSAYRIRNIRVTAPDGKVLWEGPPAIEPTAGGAPPAGGTGGSPAGVPGSSQAPAGEPPWPPAAEGPGGGRAGFVSLFNGKDLSGWTFPLGDRADWTVKGGTIRGQGAPSIIATERSDYGDFHLQAEIFNMDYGSAIHGRAFYSSDDFKHYMFATGGVSPAGATVPLGAYSIKTGGRQSTGNRPNRDGLRELTSPTLSPLAKDSWHVIEVIAIGGVLRMKVDGREVSAFEDTLSRLKRGRIGFRLVKGHGMEIRSIKIRELGGEGTAEGQAAGGAGGSPPGGPGPGTSTGGSPAPPVRADERSVVGRWTGRPTSDHFFIVKEDHTLVSEAGKVVGTWSIRGRRLSLRWPDKAAPGGVWIDECDVTPDGTFAMGRNQVGRVTRWYRVK